MHVHKGRIDVLAQSQGLSGDAVNALFEDREENIWTATINGLDRFRDFPVATLTQEQGLSSAIVGAVLADRDGSVWVSTRGGLNRWKNGQVNIYPIGRDHQGVKPHDLPNSLFQDANGRVWVSTPRGLGHLENGRFVSLSAMPDGAVVSMAQDRAGNLWVANEHHGLFHLSPHNDVRQISWAELGHKDHASVLAADPSQDGLWIGFFLGGISYFVNGQIHASYATADGLGEGLVGRFQFDRDGTLWIATEGGLSRLKDGHIANVTIKDRFSLEVVNLVIEDDPHSFWLYMPCGLVRISRAELDAWAAAADRHKDAKRTIQVTVFDSSDGVRSLASGSHLSPPVAKSSDGKLWFTPWDGVSVVDPRHIPFNKVPPPVHIEQVVADRKSYDVASDANGNLHLPPNVRDLRIDYTALSLVAPEKVHFRYKLEGQDPDWREVVNDRRAQYSNLAPRNYRFRVKACNNSGVWNEEGASLDFTIAPAYYQTNLFLALLAAAFVALLWGLYRFRVQQLRRQEGKLRDVVETIPTFAWTALPDGSVDFVNRYWQEYTGLSTEKTVGSGWQAAIHPEDLTRNAEKWSASLATGKAFENEVRYRRRADAQYRWFLTRAVPLRDARGKILKWYGTSTDIEDRKRAEQLQSDLAHITRVNTMVEMSASLAH